jgi:hypothetical protein
MLPSARPDHCMEDPGTKPGSAPPTVRMQLQLHHWIAGIKGFPNSRLSGHLSATDRLTFFGWLQPKIQTKLN